MAGDHSGIPARDERGLICRANAQGNPAVQRRVPEVLAGAQVGQRTQVGHAENPERWAQLAIRHFLSVSGKLGLQVLVLPLAVVDAVGSIAANAVAGLEMLEPEGGIVQPLRGCLCRSPALNRLHDAASGAGHLKTKAATARGFWIIRRLHQSEATLSKRAGRSLLVSHSG